MKTTWEKIAEYARSIKNEQKRFYAIAYAEFRTGYRIEVPDANHYPMRLLAKESVEQNIESILKGSILAMPELENT
jgi:hypothetical protein